MTPLEIQFTKEQFDFITCDDPYPAFVGGFGSGKTESLVNKALVAKSAYPECDIAYYMPTFDLIGLFGMPRFEEKLEVFGASYKAIKSPRPIIKIENGGSIIFRTMDRPGRIIGYEVADSYVDELDTLNELNAQTVWRAIVARNRQKKPDGKRNTISVGTTPEGYKFVYKTWKKEPKAGYKIYKGSTYSNQRNLPENYIPDLIDLYPANLVEAYINGEFVNLTSGSVYPNFDRVKNNSLEVVSTVKWSDGSVHAEDLHIGIDFNVTKMAAIVFVKRDRWPVAVAEVTKQFDTRAMITAIKTRWPNNKINVYPDASGGSRKSNDASVSDISLLRDAGFFVYANSVNPAVKDRVLSMNGLILNGKNERKLLVNVQQCPQFTEGLEKQVYDKNGDPDKSSGLDHTLDAGGYFIAYTFPVRKTNVGSLKIVGM